MADEVNPKQKRITEIERDVEAFKSRETQEKVAREKLTQIFNESPSLAKTLSEIDALYVRDPDNASYLFSLCKTALAAMQTATKKVEVEKGLKPNSPANCLRPELEKYRKLVFGETHSIELPLTKQIIPMNTKGLANYYIDYKKALARNKTLRACQRESDALLEYAILNASNLEELILYAYGKTSVFKYAEMDLTTRALATET